MTLTKNNNIDVSGVFTVSVGRFDGVFATVVKTCYRHLQLQLQFCWLIAISPLCMCNFNFSLKQGCVKWNYSIIASISHLCANITLYIRHRHESFDTSQPVKAKVTQERNYHIMSQDRRQQCMNRTVISCAKYSFYRKTILKFSVHTVNFQ